jgi:hypothetical protein
MDDLVYSITNGKYYISSRDNYHLLNILINNIQTIVGISQQNYNGNMSIFTVQTLPTKQYGYIKVGTENTFLGYLTYSNFPGSDSNSVLTITKDLFDDKNQIFCLSSDGRIILPLQEPILTIINNNSKLISTTDRSKYKWKFSTFIPPRTGFHNISSIDLTYPIDPNEAKQYFDKDETAYCTSNTTCGKGETNIKDEESQGGFVHRTYCLKTVFDDRYKSPCCRGDVSILNEGKNTFNYDKCKLTYGKLISGDRCNTIFTDNDINSKVKTQQERAGTWFPWSDNCAKTSDTMNFCLQHDTLIDQPMIRSNPNCVNWCIQNPTECKSVKIKYCEDNPQDPNCFSWCNNGELESNLCKEIIGNFCQGENLKTTTCRLYCSNITGNCDDPLSKYCKSLGTNAIKEPICGCFMGTPFYDTFFKSLSNEGLTVSYPIPDCFYPKCANSSIKTHTWYTLQEEKKNTCPNVNSCINQITINVDGSIDTKEFKIEQKNTCNWGLRPSDCEYNERIDSKANTCVKCPDISLPTVDKKTCVCPNNQILKDDKCVCPDTFIKTEDKKSCICPPTFVPSEDKKSCVCPEGKVKIGNICDYAQDFTLELVDYIKTDLPINNEIDKGKVIVNAYDIANSVLANGCNQNLTVAKECSNFIPFICSINGAKEYCNDNSDDTEFCNIDGTPKIVNSAYGYECNKIRKPVKPECKDDQYLDVDNICKNCPLGMKLINGKCEVVECGDNEYYDFQIRECVNCEEKIVGPDGHSCVNVPFRDNLINYINNIDFDRYKNINRNKIPFYKGEIISNVLNNCNDTFEHAKECVDNLLNKCDNNEKSVYGFDCSKIVDKKENNIIIYVLIAVISLILVFSFIRKKKV